MEKLRVVFYKNKRYELTDKEIEVKFKNSNKGKFDNCHLLPGVEIFYMTPEEYDSLRPDQVT